MASRTSWAIRAGRIGHLLVPHPDTGRSWTTGPLIAIVRDRWSAYAERVPHEWADFPVHWSGNSGPLLLASITIRRMVGALPRQRVDGDRIAVIDAGKSTLRAAVFAGEQMLARHDEPEGLPHPEAPGAQEAVLRSEEHTSELQSRGHL